MDVNSYAAARLGYDWGMSGLNTTAKNLGIALEGHHTALPDAMACYEVYRKVANVVGK
ncbi:hypothetical protein HY406_01795 [Candidatus Giovannonibacteria bacterium]|nr:hypothetical protein [Candidatus Giovannonibacteria bacterium]